MGVTLGCTRQEYLKLSPLTAPLGARLSTWCGREPVASPRLGSYSVALVLPNQVLAQSRLSTGLKLTQACVLDPPWHDNRSSGPNQCGPLGAVCVRAQTALLSDGTILSENHCIPFDLQS